MEYDYACSSLTHSHLRVQDHGEFGPFDPLVMAQVIRVEVDGFSFQLGDPADVDHCIAETVASFVRATAA